MYQILLIEDNPTDANLVKEALYEHGVPHVAVVLDDGEKALTHLQNVGSQPLPDLIIVDLNLPKRDGIEILIHYRMNVALLAAPIIVLTSSDSSADRRKVKSLGVGAFFRKPLLLPEFLSLGAKFKNDS